jgi:hypothetical protein
VPGRPRLLICLPVAAVAAGLGAVAVTLAQHDDPAAASTRLDQARVEREVTLGLVDISANLQYNNEVSDDTGIILSADGLVLTSSNDIAGATSVKATLAGPIPRGFWATTLSRTSPCSSSREQRTCRRSPSGTPAR